MGCPSAKPERCFEIYDFEVMLCVAELGSFRKAGLRLDIGQSAVSRRTQKIEDVIGVSLFERYAGGARLTAAGARFAKRARAVVSNFEEAISVARAAATGEQGNLRTGLLASLHIFQPCDAAADRRLDRCRRTSLVGWPFRPMRKRRLGRSVDVGQ